jgi:hypothetical protein
MLARSSFARGEPFTARDDDDDDDGGPGSIPIPFAPPALAPSEHGSAWCISENEIVELQK